MKRVIIAAILFVLSACAHPQPMIPTQAQLNDFAKASTFTGTVVKGHFVKGIGWDINLQMDVRADDGSEASFYVRKDSIVSDVDGKYLGFLDYKVHNRKVEIKYSTIMDSTGGGGGSGFSFEVGKNGVLLMRFLD